MLLRNTVINLAAVSSNSKWSKPSNFGVKQHWWAKLGCQSRCDCDDIGILWCFVTFKTILFLTIALACNRRFGDDSEGEISCCWILYRSKGWKFSLKHIPPEHTSFYYPPLSVQDGWYLVFCNVPSRCHQRRNESSAGMEGCQPSWKAMLALQLL